MLWPSSETIHPKDMTLEGHVVTDGLEVLTATQTEHATKKGSVVSVWGLGEA